MTHKDLVESASKWVRNDAGCAAVLDLEHVNLTGKYPNIIGFASFGKTVAVEVLVSREEYLEEVKTGNRFSPETSIGKYRFICVPAGTVQEEELPQNWGLITVSEDKQVSLEVNPYSPPGSDWWRNGFEDSNLYDLLVQNESLNSVCRRLQYKAVLYLEKNSGIS